MKLALFNDYIPGVLNGDAIVDISDVAGSVVMNAPGKLRMTALIENFDGLRVGIEEAAKRPGQPIDSVKLRAPVPRPGKMLFGMGNYRENMAGFDYPLDMFLKSPATSPIQDGETMTVEIEGIGQIFNKVSDPLKRKWPVGPDPLMEAGVKVLKATGVMPSSLWSTKRIA